MTDNRILTRFESIENLAPGSCTALTPALASTVIRFLNAECPYLQAQAIPPEYSLLSREFQNLALLRHWIQDDRFQTYAASVYGEKYPVSRANFINLIDSYRRNTSGSSAIGTLVGTLVVNRIYINKCNLYRTGDD